MYYQVFELHANLLKALSHAKRLEIVHLLRDRELPVGEIQDMLDLSQSNLSQHLMYLRDAEIVETRRDGKQIYYSIANKNFIKASDLLRQVLAERYKNDPLADEFTRKMEDLMPLTQDPVCRMRLSPKTAAFAHKKNGSEYYFCASGCLEKFQKSPDKYINK